MDEDVPVFTSLPPKVDGQLRCCLKLKIPAIRWLVSNPPDEAVVRVVWWGEEGDGSLFRFIHLQSSSSK